MEPLVLQLDWNPVCLMPNLTLSKYYLTFHKGPLTVQARHTAWERGCLRSARSARKVPEKEEKLCRGPASQDSPSRAKRTREEGLSGGYPNGFSFSKVDQTETDER